MLHSKKTESRLRGVLVEHGFNHLMTSKVLKIVSVRVDVREV